MSSRSSISHGIICSSSLKVVSTQTLVWASFDVFSKIMRKLDTLLSSTWDEVFFPVDVLIWHSINKSCSIGFATFPAGSIQHLTQRSTILTKLHSSIQYFDDGDVDYDDGMIIMKNISWALIMRLKLI